MAGPCRSFLEAPAQDYRSTGGPWRGRSFRALSEANGALRVTPTKLNGAARRGLGVSCESELDFRDTVNTAVGKRLAAAVGTFSSNTPLPI